MVLAESSEFDSHPGPLPADCASRRRRRPAPEDGRASRLSVGLSVVPPPGRPPTLAADPPVLPAFHPGGSSVTGEPGARLLLETDV